MPNSCSGYLFTRCHIWKLVSMAYKNAISIHVIIVNEFEEIEFQENEFHVNEFHENALVVSQDEELLPQESHSHALSAFAQLPS